MLCAGVTPQFYAKMTSQRDRRLAIRALLDSGMKVTEVARQTGATRKTVASVRDAGVERKAYKRQNSARTPDLVAQVAQKINENANTTVRALARDAGAPETTMRRLVKQDLGMASYAVAKRQRLTPEGRRKRQDRSCALINRLKGPDAGKVILFQDEKYFTLAQYHNRRNSKVILRQGDREDERRFIGVAQRPAGVMFFGVIASDGKIAPPIFVEPGLKINAPAYQDIIRRELKPWVDANYAPGTFVYQQDGAPAHTAASTQAFFDELGWDFWRKEEWPAHSPDLAPLDYAIWEPMRRKACAEEAPSLEVLRQRVSEAWLAQTPAFIRRVCRGFRRRLAQVVAAQGGYIEKK